MFRQTCCYGRYFPVGLKQLRIESLRSNQGKGDPYAILYCGRIKLRSKSVSDHGSKPVWKRKFTFPVDDSTSELSIQIFNANVLEDNKIGSAMIPLGKVFNAGNKLPTTSFTVICPSGRTKGDIATFTPKKSEKVPKLGHFGSGNPGVPAPYRPGSVPGPYCSQAYPTSGASLLMHIQTEHYSAYNSQPYSTLGNYAPSISHSESEHTLPSNAFHQGPYIGPAYLVPPWPGYHVGPPFQQNQSLYPSTSYPTPYLNCAFSSLSPAQAPAQADQSLSLGSKPSAIDSTVSFKKKVALWVGYVGTQYKGLQIQRRPGSAQTIEEELERAIYKAGGIIDSNYGNLHKVSWTRSSRTDKGVHSLCTVVSMKMEVPLSAWVSDMDGIALAEGINMHLPRSIRVFGVIPVTRSFQARHDCCTRTYNYLLPAAIIGIQFDTSPSDVEQRVKDFQSILASFEGKHPYHNYTIRRLYRHYSQKVFVSRLEADMSVGVSDDPPEVPLEKTRPDSKLATLESRMLDEDGDLADELADVLEGELADKMVSTFAESKGGVSPTYTSPMDAEGGVPSTPRAWWLPTPDAADKIASAHFRRVLSCTCRTPEISGGVHFIRVSITGNSFMVHQIRKMVGTAVAVFRELLPQDTIPMSLSCHVRIVLPLAPPEGLILSSNEFLPFRVPPYYKKNGDPEVNATSGRSCFAGKSSEQLPRLAMSEVIANRADKFSQAVLMPEITPLLNEAEPTWNVWLDNLERNVGIPEDELAEVRESWANWHEHSVRVKQMRQKID